MNSKTQTGMVQTRKMIVSKEGELQDNGYNFKNIHKTLMMRLIPEFKYRVFWKDQTPKTRWRLHLLAVMSKDGQRPSPAEMWNAIEQTEPYFT